jgi:hypothetical protein
MAEKVAPSKNDLHRLYLSCKLAQKKLEYRRRHCPYRHINVSSFTISMASPERAIGSQCYKFAKQMPKEVLEGNFMMES